MTNQPGLVEAVDAHEYISRSLHLQNDNALDPLSPHDFQHFLGTAFVEAGS